MFDRKKKLVLELPGSELPFRNLLTELTLNHLKERPELFVIEGAMFFFFNQSRPGILVLINEADWELEGASSSVIQDGDNVVFISTLHGG